MTLVELMIATGLGTVVLSAVMALTIFSARSFAAVTNYVDLDVKSRTAVDRMSQEIRQATNVLTCNATQLILRGVNIATGTGYTLTYTYDPVSKKLTQSKTGEADQVLLTQCESLSWTNMFQRTMSFTSDPTGQPDIAPTLSACKVIQLNWVCSRNLLGKAATTESVQSAEVVIRTR